MKILAVEASAASASVAVCDNEFLTGEYFVNIRQTHSETLMPMIGELLNRCGMDISQIELFAVDSGPGSFTGVRIAVAAVKGLAIARKVPCVAVSTLEAAARNIPYFDGIVCAVMDARRNQVYNALFSCTGNDVQRLTEDRAIRIDQLGNELISSGKKVLFVGDGALLCYNILKDQIHVEIAPERLRYQRASGVASAGFVHYKQEGGLSAADLQPYYLRLPQAERELRKRTGMDNKEVK